MKKSILCITALLLSFAASTFAQKLPDGWEVRFDSPHSSLSDITFTHSGDDIHLSTGPAHAIFYRGTDNLKGNYEVSATFKMDKNASGHGEAYGLFVGGKNLQKDSQHYLYYLTRRDGKYLIKTRDGESTHTFVGWSPSETLKAEKGSQAQTNFLAIKVGSGAVSFWANGEKITSIPKSKLPDTDGIAGMRINHHLTIDVQNLKMTKGNQ